jgi:hypothetical protein
MYMTHAEEIMGLKKGDAVLVRWGHSSSAERVVERVTATQVIVNGIRYYRRDDYKAGREVGRSKWSTCRIVALTPALRAEREAEARREGLQIDAQEALLKLGAFIRSSKRTDAELESFRGFVNAVLERGLPKW